MPEVKTETEAGSWSDTMPQVEPEAKETTARREPDIYFSLPADLDKVVPLPKGFLMLHTVEGVNDTVKELEAAIEAGEVFDSCESDLLVSNLTIHTYAVKGKEYVLFTGRGADISNVQFILVFQDR